MVNHIAIPKVTHYGTVNFGPDVSCQAIVLDDGRRGFNRRQMVELAGFHKKVTGHRFSRFLGEISPNALKIYEETSSQVSMPNGATATFVSCDVVPEFASGDGILTAYTMLTYAFHQVLNTPQTALPRNVIAVFLCLIGFVPMGDGPVRKAGRTSVCVCSTSPAIALNSMALSLANRSNPL